MQAEVKVLVLGIGNLLWADEGFGVRAVEALNTTYECPDGVTIMDGGTQGLYLLPYVQDCTHLIVLDAVDYGLEPGSLKLVRDDEVPTYMGAKKVSLHQTGFQEVLASARLLNWAPQRIVLIGVQPQEIEDYGGSLRPVVSAQIETVVGLAVAEIEALGMTMRLRQAADGSALGPDPLARRDYERGRPGPDDACRVGDERFLTLRAR